MCSRIHALYQLLRRVYYKIIHKSFHEQSTVARPSWRIFDVNADTGGTLVRRDALGVFASATVFGSLRFRNVPFKRDSASRSRIQLFRPDPNGLVVVD